jgi:hypothetical protein
VWKSESRSASKKSKIFDAETLRRRDKRREEKSCRLSLFSLRGLRASASLRRSVTS